MVTQILKMDENNQYGNAMTTPLPTDSIKKIKKVTSMREFDLIMHKILAKDKIVHLFMVDMQLDHEYADEKQLFFNKIYTSIFEKTKVLSVNERSVLQLLDVMRLNDKGSINSYKTTAKTHATMDKKFATPLYAEYLHSLLLRCGWKVSKVQVHYTFEKSKFKKNLSL